MCAVLKYFCVFLSGLSSYGFVGIYILDKNSLVDICIAVAS